MEAAQAGRLTRGVPVLVEACVDAIDAAREAAQGGAGRIELCGELLQGGVTPSAGLIGAVRAKVAIPLFVLVRPRPGDFLYSNDERDVMRRDVAQARSLGADGVVVGALTSDGDVDAEVVRELIGLARPMAVTFHRAFDFARDRAAALETLIGLGVDRVLTSGGAATALEGAPLLAALVAQAKGRIGILAGGSITSANVAEVVRASGVGEVHVRAALPLESAMRHRRAEVSLSRPAPPGDYVRAVARASEVTRVVEAALSS
jgi:copper homeostasis protein